MTMWQFFALNNFTKSTGTIKNMVTHCADPLKNGTGMKSTGNYSSAWESLITSTFFPRFSPWDMEFSRTRPYSGTSGFPMGEDLSHNYL